ncbi:MAG TPA: hypothetical protein VHW45_09040 [Candidatus Sulfotelmatobacter sp.]|nr:hypothetical protein [Candidatus Sulfotelmatobacter sp.]
MRKDRKSLTRIAAHVLGTLAVPLWVSQQCSPTTVLAITDVRNHRIILAADSLVRHRYAPPENRCKIQVVTSDCAFAMVGMYRYANPAFDLSELGESACRSAGDLKQRADNFLATALPRVAEIVKALEITDPAYLKQRYEGKPVIEVLFAGQQEQRPAVFTRGTILEDGVLKPEAISVPSDRIDVFAGVNGHIRSYVRSHPGWEEEGAVNAALRLINLEAAAHPDLVGLPISIGTVESNGKFHWIERGKCGLQP